MFNCIVAIWILFGATRQWINWVSLSKAEETTPPNMFITSGFELWRTILSASIAAVFHDFSYFCCDVFLLIEIGTVCPIFREPHITQLIWVQRQPISLFSQSPSCLESAWHLETRWHSCSKTFSSWNLCTAEWWTPSTRLDVPGYSLEIPISSKTIHILAYTTHVFIIFYDWG